MTDYFKKFFEVTAVFNILALVVVFLLERLLNLGVCELCYYQRAIFVAIIVISIVAIFIKIIHKFAGVLVVLLFLANSGIALTQVLMEEGFIRPSEACTGLIPSGTSDLETFKTIILNNGYMPCDTAAFKFIGISLAGYSFIASTSLFLFGVFFVGIFIFFRYKSEEERFAKRTK
jgi:disulfide bond formation protein DsbB